MEIVEYNEKRQMLSLRYNTHVVWKYSPVTKTMYTDILNAESPEKCVKRLFRHSNVLGVYKGDK